MQTHSDTIGKWTNIIRNTNTKFADRKTDTHTQMNKKRGLSSKCNYTFLYSVTSGFKVKILNPIRFEVSQGKTLVTVTAVNLSSKGLEANSTETEMQ